MADGQINSMNPEFPIQAAAVASNMNALLIDTATDADQGVWINLTPFSRLAIEVTGTAASFSVQLYGSNAANIPANSSDGSTIGSAITTKGISYVEMPCRYIKAHATAVSGGNLSVTINAVAP